MSRSSSENSGSEFNSNSEEYDRKKGKRTKILGETSKHGRLIKRSEKYSSGNSPPARQLSHLRKPREENQTVSLGSRSRSRGSRSRSRSASELFNASNICGICQTGGNLIPCDECPKAYHKKCTNIKKVEGKFLCEQCKRRKEEKCNLCEEKISISGDLVSLACPKCRGLNHYECVGVPFKLLIDTPKYIHFPEMQAPSEKAGSQPGGESKAHRRSSISIGVEGVKTLTRLEYICTQCQRAFGVDKIMDVYNYQDGELTDLKKLNNYYLVKFKDISYLHSCWINYTMMKELSIQKMKNFENRMENEEVEDIIEINNLFHGIDLEHIEVDRIIDKKIGKKSSGNLLDIKYLVKWKGMFYEDSTWECEADLLKSFDDKIAQFEKLRTIEDNLRSGDSKTIGEISGKHKEVKFRKYTEQPDYITELKLELHPYQLEGFNWLNYSWHVNTNVILADEMGLGKTIQCAAFLRYLFLVVKNRGPFCICAPLSTLDNWNRELGIWFPEANVILYSGGAKSREIIRNCEMFFNTGKSTRGKGKSISKHRMYTKFTILLCSYDILLMDTKILKKVKWEVFVVDEGQRLKNSNSKLYKEIMCFNCKFKALLTGTPLQNNIQELMNLMQFIAPNKFCEETQELIIRDFDTLIEGGTRNSEGEDQLLVSKMHEELKPHMLRRMKKDVQFKIPRKKELIVRVDLSATQKQIYKCICTRNFQALKELDKKSKTKISIKSITNILMLLRLCTNHALLLSKEYNNSVPNVDQYNPEEKPKGKRDEAEEREKELELERKIVSASGKMQILDKMLTRLKVSGHRVLIFSQFRMMLDIIEDYMRLKCYNYCRLDGTTPPLERQKLIDAFNTQQEVYFCFLLSTRAGGLGINLASADTVIMYDSDFNPHNDIQAYSRAHRIGQTKKVMIYRLIVRDTIEEKIVEIAKRKLMLEHLIVKSKNESLNKTDLDKILRFGTEKLFVGEEETKEDIFYTEKLIDELLDRGDEEREEDNIIENKEGRIDDYLGAFKVAHFESKEIPDEITENIPKEERNVPTEEYWQNLLQDSYLALVTEEQAQFGKGKRLRKHVHYADNVYDEQQDSEFELNSHNSSSSSDNNEHEGSIGDSMIKEAKAKGKRIKNGKRKRPSVWRLLDVNSGVGWLGNREKEREVNMVLHYSNMLADKELFLSDIVCSSSGIINPEGEKNSELLKEMKVSLVEPLDLTTRINIILWGFTEVNRMDFLNGLMKWGVFDHDWEGLYLKLKKETATSLTTQTLSNFEYYAQQFSTVLYTLYNERNFHSHFFFLDSYTPLDICTRLCYLHYFRALDKEYEGKDKEEFTIEHPRIYIYIYI